MTCRCKCQQICCCVSYAFVFYHRYNEEILLLRAMGKVQDKQQSKIADDDDGDSSSSSHSSPTDEDFSEKNPLEHLMASPRKPKVDPPLAVV